MADPLAFISYKHESRAQRLADQLCSRLTDYGIEVWYDGQLNGGEHWSQAIDAKIESASFVIVIVTPASAASHYVTYEWSLALGKGKPVIPLLLEGTENTMHPRMSLIQHRDFRTQFEEEWKLLFRDIDRIVKRMHPALTEDTQPTVPSVNQTRHAARHHTLSEWDKSQLRDFVNIMPYKLLRRLNPVDILDFHVYGQHGTGKTVFARLVQLNDLMERRLLETISDKKLARLLVATCEKILSLRLAPTGTEDDGLFDPESLDQGRIALEDVKQAYRRLGEYVKHTYGSDLALN